VFRLTTNGALTDTVYFNSTDGYWPMSGLTLVTNGNFIHLYGTRLARQRRQRIPLQVNQTTAYAWRRTHEHVLSLTVKWGG